MRNHAHVTDHALVRWLERVVGIDMEGYRAVLAAEVEPAVRAGAAGMIKGGHTYVLDGPVLVTVLPTRPMHAQRERRRMRHDEPAITVLLP